MIAIKISIISAIVSSLMVVVGLITFGQQKRQNNNMVKTAQVDAMMKITQSHKSLFLDILNDDVLTSIVSTEDDISTFRRKMVGTVLINHCNTIYMYALKSLIDKDDWTGLQNDILDFFSWPVVKDRWPEIRGFYSIDFQDFIDDLTIRRRKNYRTKDIVI